MASNGLALHCRSFRVPKQGFTLEECQDACAANQEDGRFAIADGASESGFAGIWAQMLADGFARSTGLRGEWSAWLPPAQTKWQDEVSSRPLPWYAETKAAEGAFATIVAIVFAPKGWWGQRRWRALAVGDSCLFHIRCGCLQQAFPCRTSEDFDNSPWLVGSRDNLNDLSKKELRTGGRCQQDDRLWLMTDALAQWFLQQIEQVKKPWEIMEKLIDQPENEFSIWVQELRDRKEMRNDDVTWLAVRV